MFEVDDPPVSTPKRRLPTNPRWSRYHAKALTKCDDCMLLLALAKGQGPAARFARQRRTAGATDLLLCDAHAQVRREEDGK